MKTKIFFFSLLCVLCIGCLFLVNNDLSNTNASLSGQLQQQERTYSGRIDELSAYQETLVERISLLEENYNKLQTSYDELKTAYEQYMKDSTLEREQIQATVTDLKATIATLEDNADVDQATISNLRSQVRTLETSLENQTTTANQLQVTIDQQEATIEELNARIDELIEDLNSDIQLTFYKNLMAGEITEITAEDLDGVTCIRPYAFAFCSNLISIEIPDSCLEIKMSAFMNCDSLTTLSLGNGLQRIGNSAFRCRALANIDWGQSLQYIGDYAFVECAITSVVFPSSLRYIGMHIFNFCPNLTSIILNDDIEEIASYAFYDNPSVLGLVENNIQYIGSNSNPYLFASRYVSGNDSTATVVVNDRTKILGVVFNQYVEEVVIPEGVEVIGYSCFYRCSKLTDVKLPNSLKKIAHDAFYYCTSLTTLIIPDSVEQIDYGCFSGSTSLTSIYIPDLSVIKYSVAVTSSTSYNYSIVDHCPNVIIYTGSYQAIANPIWNCTISSTTFAPVKYGYSLDAYLAEISL